MSKRGLFEACHLQKGKKKTMRSWPNRSSFGTPGKWRLVLGVGSVGTTGKRCSIFKVD